MNSNTNVTCRICNQNIETNFRRTKSIVDGTDFFFYYCGACDALSSQSYDRSSLYLRKASNTNFTPQSQTIFNILKRAFIKINLKKTLNRIPRGAKALDYGCGNGDVANIFSDMGLQSHAFDIQVERPLTLSDAVTYWNAKDFDKSDLFFDVIILRHVLEHVPDPIYVIEQLTNRLTKDGTLIIEVPNYNSVFRKLMGERWTGYFSPYHEMVFSEKTFSKICEKLNLSYNLKLKEPFIFGVFFMHLGVSRVFARFLSIVVYPLQFAVNKAYNTGEAIECSITKRKY